MKIKAVYFVGIGGIGMSAIARYFLSRGIFVGGYDRTPSDLTEQLRKEGAVVHYEDNVALIPTPCRDKEDTLVVYTPAIPADHSEMTFFRQQGFEIQKRAQVLGTLTRTLKGLCVAGTHGKTTTSSMAAHLLHQSHVDCNAFLGGITKNYGTNYILSQKSPFVVIEAEFLPLAFPIRQCHHGYRCRPSRHLWHRGGLPRELPQIQQFDSLGRLPCHAHWTEDATRCAAGGDGLYLQP